MSEVVAKEAAPLDELMLAMDVVDTLRHRELVLEREVQADDRDQRLLGQLREIYASQGIAVSDEALEQGVRALREERFVYSPPPATVSRSLATLYVTRSKWGKWVAGVAVVLAISVLAFQLFVRGPELRAAREVPNDLEGAYQGILVSTQNSNVLSDAQSLHATGAAAVATRDYAAARAAVAELRALGDRLQQQYEVRIISRPGELSGVWRVPEGNRAAQNYYLIVEAIAPNGRVLELPIVNEENGRVRRVRKWGLRVDEATFNRVAADKRDDGIIEDAVVGVKRRGSLDPEYAVATTGAAITSW